jgi:hypothetical protein
MKTRLFAIVFSAFLGFGCVLPLGASVLTLDAPEIYDRSVTHDLDLSASGGEIQLAAGELFEDDGPASGHSYQKPENREMLSSQTWIKKDLIIPNPQAWGAHLVVLSDQPFETTINGIPTTLGTNQSGRPLHRTFSIDPQLLRAGNNDIILRESGRVTIARDDEYALGSRTRTKHPGRSAKSTDGGKSWDYNHLGPEGQLEGEYGVRLYLDHYRPQGSLTLPVIDAGNLEAKSIGEPITAVGPIKITADGDPVTTGQILVRARSGDTYVPTAEHWSDWQELGAAGGILQQPRGRFVEVAVELRTSDPLQTPRLRKVSIEAAPVRPADWTARIHIIDSHDEEIVRTSIPFKYEPLDHPRLKKLREDYKLDDVVKGAKGEMELLLRLAKFACDSWDWPNHISDCYPAWDALEILKPYGDGKPTGGFCLQFNLVMLQAAESFGFPGRAISISPGGRYEKVGGGGHEVVEFWSNEWEKWVYVDGALGWYILDEKTGVPLSLWELRQDQLPVLHNHPVPPVRVVKAGITRNTQFPWKGLGPEPQNWYLELRMIPRANFLQEKSPLPLSQGTDEWSWTGHYVWTDAEVPAGLLFGNRVTKKNDWMWTLNQAHYVLEPQAPGVFRVHLDTETPSFDTFLAEIDGGEQKSVASVFTWTLHSGRNQLRVKPRNLLAREGIPSWISLNYVK